MESNNVSYLHTKNKSTSHEWFEHDPDCRWIVDKNCRLVAANLSARTAINKNQVVTQHHGKLSFGGPDNNKKIETIICQLMDHDNGCRRHVVLRVLDGKWRSFSFTCVHANQARQIIIAMKNDCQAQQADIQSLAQAFDLTPTEALVLAAMKEVDQPKVIASNMGISIYTVRAHLRTIYAKMGARGHSAALRLLINLLN